MIQRQDKYGNTSTDLGPVLVYDKYGKLKKLPGVGGTGVQGPQGPAGGPQGVQGAQGFQGRQGPQGDIGAQGNQGTQGDQGPQGVQGIQGPQGAQGTQGFKGDQGPQGVQGIQGPQGAQGTQGFKGDQGPQGVQGTKGDQGFQGNQGNSGISSGATYYFNQSQSSDVSPYKVLAVSPIGGAQQTVVVNMTGSQQNVQVQEFLTPQLGFAVIPGGTQRFHFHYLKPASNDSIEAYATIQLANSTGTPIGPVITTGASLIGWVDASTPAEVTLDLTLPTTTIDPTNRMIVKIYLSNFDATAHTVTWYTEGTQYYAFVVTTVGVIGNQGVTGPQGDIGATYPDTVTLYIDAKPDIIATGKKAQKIIPYDASISDWYIISEQTGNIEFDIKTSSFSTYPSLSSIVGLTPPKLNNQSVSSDSPSWGNVNSGDVIEFYVTSNDVIKTVGLYLTLQKI